MAIKFRVDEADLDGVYNVVVKGVYMDGTTEVGGTKVFSFDPSEVSVAGMQDAVSAAQPVPDAEEEAKKQAGETALAIIASKVGTQVTLDAPVEPEV